MLSRSLLRPLLPTRTVAWPFSLPSLASPYRSSLLQQQSRLLATWGGGKLKSHSGAKKRFLPVGGFGNLGFKRGHPGKQHLNSGMSRTRLARLRGTVVERSGKMKSVLKRLIGPSI